MTDTAVIIGLPGTCRRVEQQLRLLDDPPEVIGWILTDPTVGVAGGGLPAGVQVLGRVDRLEPIVTACRPTMALVSLPAALSDQVTAIRTHLRRLGVPDRYMPTIEDQLAGIGPRSQLEIDPAALLGRPPRSIDERSVRQLLRGRRVLITGAGGSIGGELARFVALHRPQHLALVDRSENALFDIDRRIARLAPRLGRTALLHDVVDAPETLVHFQRLRPELVFHAAAHKHVPMMEDHPASAIDNNLFGTKSVADAAAATGVQRLVMISTDKAVNPSSIMGATKRLAELYVQQMNRRSDTRCVMVRFGNVLGSSGSVLESWGRQLAEGGPITVTHAGMTRYFMTIPEAAALVVQSAALTAVEPGEVFLLDMGEPVEILKLALRFIRLHGLTPVLPDGPPPARPPAEVRIVFTGPRPGEKLHERLTVDAEQVRPTAHPDINICICPPPSDRYIKKMLHVLDPVRRPSGPGALADLVRQLVPDMERPVAA